MIKGIAASSGIAIGKAFVISENVIEVKETIIKDTAMEKDLFHKAIKTAKAQLEAIKASAESKMGKDKAEIFGAHIMMLEDPELIGAVESSIEQKKYKAEYAVKTTIEMFASMMDSMEDEYMKERAADIRDVGQRLFNIILGVENTAISEINRSCIIVARDLTPSDTAQMDRKLVLGFVTDVGGRTSHSAIMARTLEIPAVVGTGNASSVIKNGDNVIIDGDGGVVLVNPDDETIGKYKNKQDQLHQYNKSLEVLKNAESISKDGKKVEIAGNIGGPKDVMRVLENGGEGVGLFRTEFLYMDKKSFPTEEEQFNAYREVLEGMQGKPVVIRTLDIGGDKKLSYLSIPEEMNPFLGYRAIRLCLDRKDIFKTQLRALLRASAYGNLRIMFPMISGVNELREAKKVIEEVKSKLASENIEISDEIQIGIMIEIPSAAVISDMLAKEVDFFSIGTNDLIQYTVAVDRMNEKVSYLYSPLNPGVLRLIKLVIDNAHREGKWVGVCGEMAGDLNAIPVLLGMGLDEFSMSASSILKARKLIGSLSYEEMKNMTSEVLNMPTPEEILKHIESIINN